MRKAEGVLASISVAMLCLAGFDTAHAAPITFTGSIDRAGAAQVVPNISLCGVAPPNVHVTEPLGIGASNLGAFSAFDNHCTNVATGTTFNGLFTFDFGSGDTLSGTSEGTIVGPLPPTPGTVLDVTTMFTVTGGTGSFAGFTGDLLGNGTVTVTVSGPTSHMDITGTISTVPEPATMLLFGAGLATAGLTRRRVRLLRRSATRF